MWAKTLCWAQVLRTNIHSTLPQRMCPAGNSTPWNRTIRVLLPLSARTNNSIRGTAARASTFLTRWQFLGGISLSQDLTQTPRLRNLRNRTFEGRSTLPNNVVSRPQSRSHRPLRQANHLRIQSTAPTEQRSSAWSCLRHGIERTVRNAAGGLYDASVRALSVRLCWQPARSRPVRTNLTNAHLNGRRWLL